MTDRTDRIATFDRARAPERRRSDPDRRRRLFWSLIYGGLRPRRRDGRRVGDLFQPIVDWHGPGLFASAFLVLVLCVIDALLTVQLLSAGADEANPVMALYTEGDGHRFAAMKLFLTGAGLLVLVAMARFRVFRILRVATLVHGVLAGYAVLVAYELLLVGRYS